MGRRSCDANGNRLTATGTTTAHYNPAKQVTDGNSYDLETGGFRPRLHRRL